MGLVTTALLTALQINTPPLAPQVELSTAAWSTVGARIPSIELPLIDGSGTLDLADLRGRKLLLIQFAAW